MELEIALTDGTSCQGTAAAVQQQDPFVQAVNTSVPMAAVFRALQYATESASATMDRTKLAVLPQARALDSLVTETFVYRVREFAMVYMTVRMALMKSIAALV